MFRNDFPLTVVFFSAILSAMLVSCAPYSDSRRTLAMADSLDAERKLYSDTAALTTAIESMDNLWGKVVAREMLAKAYYYRGRNYERNKEQVCAAAADYICCDKLRPNNDELRGRANSCMAYICALQEDYKLACVYCTRALDYLEETEKKYYYAHALLNMCSCELNGGDMERADQLWREAETYTQTMDSAFRARLLGVRGSYYLAAQMHDSALYYLEQIPLERLTPHQQAYYEKQKMLCYYAKRDNDRAEEFAKRVIENSNEASYLAQAYSTLLYIHIQDDSLNVPVEYARPRIAAEKTTHRTREIYGCRRTTAHILDHTVPLSALADRCDTDGRDRSGAGRSTLFCDIQLPADRVAQRQNNSSQRATDSSSERGTPRTDTQHRTTICAGKCELSASGKSILKQSGDHSEYLSRTTCPLATTEQPIL